MENGTLLITLLLLVVCAGIIYAVARTLLRIWFDHRVKMALLEKLERRPELVGELQEVQELLDGPARPRDAERPQNLILTGMFLSLIGLGCALFARAWLSGLYATGFYFGGVICVPLGFLLVVLGVIMKMLARTSTPRGAR